MKFNFWPLLLMVFILSCTNNTEQERESATEETVLQDSSKGGSGCMQCKPKEYEEFEEPEIKSMFD